MAQNVSKHGKVQITRLAGFNSLSFAQRKDVLSQSERQRILRARAPASRNGNHLKDRPTAATAVETHLLVPSRFMCCS